MFRTYQAVVWTDTLQIILMFTGFLSVIIQGSFDFESFSDVLNASDRGGRLIFDDFGFDPRIRHSFWSIIFGSIFGCWGHFFCTSQSYVQRFLNYSNSLWMKLNLSFFRVLACRNRSEQRLAMYLGYLGIALILVFSFLAGLIMFAKYECCDPLTAGWIDLSVQKKKKKYFLE